MTKKCSVLAIAMLWVSAGSVLCENTTTVLWRDHTPSLVLTGNPHIDFVGQTELTPQQESQTRALNPAGTARKSPWLAAGFSLVVPGSGEFYAENYWKAAAFFLADVALWYAAYKYDNKGDRQTDFFQDFANQHWSVVQYATYAEQTLKPQGNTYAWRKPGTESWNPFDRPWSQVDWAELNRMERDISATPAGQYYSHVLPPYNDQQYYELIGKYPQFNQGWDDAPASFSYGQPLTARFIYYSLERGKANDYYNSASRFVVIAVVNHVLSALDAAWSAGSYNRAHAEIGLQTLPSQGMGPGIPAVKVTYVF
jgi:hypothetical protein